MKHVMPTLAQGLIECCKMRPDDPVDYLVSSEPDIVSLSLYSKLVLVLLLCVCDQSVIKDHVSNSEPIRCQMNQ